MNNHNINMPCYNSGDHGRLKEDDDQDKLRYCAIPRNGELDVEALIMR